MKKQTALLMMLGLSSAMAMAFNGNEGPNGGDGVRPRGGAPELADPYLKIERKPIELGGKQFALSSPLKSELRALYSIGKAYAFDESEMTDRTFGENVKYYFTEEFPDPRCRNQAQYAIPDHAAFLGTIGCTFMDKTWIKKSVFDEMSRLDQALLIVHERLRARSSSPTLNYIADVTNGLRAARLAYQRQAKGDYSALDRATIEKLSNLMLGAPVAISGENEGTIEDRAFTRQGGVVLKGAKVDPTAIIGVGTIVSTEWTIGSGVVALNSDLYVPANYDGVSFTNPISGASYGGERYRAYELLDGAFVKDSSLASASVVYVGPGARIVGSTFGGYSKDRYSNSDIMARATIHVGAKASVSRSNLTGAGILVASDARVTDSTIDTRYGIAAIASGAEVTNVTFDFQHAGSNIDLGLAMGQRVYVDGGAHLRNVSFALSGFDRTGPFASKKGWKRETMTPYSRLETEYGVPTPFQFMSGGKAHMIFPVMPPESHAFSLGEGLTLDGKGKDLCPNDFVPGGNVFVPRRIKKQEDLAKLCFDNQGLPLVSN